MYLLVSMANKWQLVLNLATAVRRWEKVIKLEYLIISLSRVCLPPHRPYRPITRTMIDIQHKSSQAISMCKSPMARTPHTADSRQQHIQLI